ncbi:MAG: lysine--tRNA ligase [Fibromonadaceae bacterium]|jgi:lysyl-tRNA synthetase class 2|nr:lysine--tRNA ligase [Fibromonadaceae bacterium]
MKQNEFVKVRLGKLAKIREQGLNPYPYNFELTHNSNELKEKAEELIAGNERISWAGRIVRYNRKGKMCFMHLKDACGRFQVLAVASELSEAEYEIVKSMDIGDWVGTSGAMMKTDSGEYTLQAKNIAIISKAIYPLPIPKEKRDENGKIIIFDEFKDIETRYRERYIDLTLNDNVREVFRKRTRIIQSIREYLLEKGFLEVETPTLQPIYGGANARPFETHHNAAGMTLYLRIAPELYLKRCIVGGLDKVFEFTKNFRNEGMDKTHSPEFTSLEFYEAFSDYNDMMVHFEHICERACIAANGTTKVEYQGKEIDFKTPWPRLSVYEAIQKYAGISVKELSDEQLKGELEKRNVELKGSWSRGRAILALFEETCEHELIQPTIIKDMPKESTPLCKAHRTDPDLVEQFEPYANGWELGNAYSELNDPVLQRELFEEQAERGRGGEEETHPMDENFLHAIECGMPPTGGAGIGIDRLVMLLTNQASIRDVQLFPLMK